MLCNRKWYVSFGGRLQQSELALLKRREGASAILFEVPFVSDTRPLRAGRKHNFLGMDHAFYVVQSPPEDPTISPDFTYKSKWKENGYIFLCSMFCVFLGCFSVARARPRRRPCWLVSEQTLGRAHALHGGGVMESGLRSAAASFGFEWSAVAVEAPAGRRPNTARLRVLNPPCCSASARVLMFISHWGAAEQQLSVALVPILTGMFLGKRCAVLLFIFKQNS